MTPIVLPSEDATQRLAQLLARFLSDGDVVALDGPRGAGKTTFVRFLGAARGGDPGQVASPTYTLMHQYQARLAIVHVDAYRLVGPGDLAGLGFDEQREGGIAVVEWAARVRGALDLDSCWRIQLDHRLGGGREATVTTPPHLAGKWLHELSAR